MSKKTKKAMDEITRLKQENDELREELVLAQLEHRLTLEINNDLLKEIKNLRHLKEENVQLMERINEIDNDVIRDLKDEIFVLNNDYAVLRAKHQIVQNDYKKCAEQRDEYKHQLNAANKDFKAQKHPMYPIHWGGLDPDIHQKAKDLTIEQTIDKVKKKTPWVEEPIKWSTTKLAMKDLLEEKSWEEAAGDLALRVAKLEEQLKTILKISFTNDNCNPQ